MQDSPSMMNELPPLPPDRFVRLLRKALAGSGHSLREVARRADISPTYLSLLLKAERGVPAREIVARLERVLQIPSGRLFDAGAVVDETTQKFLTKTGARPLMRTYVNLNEADMAKVQAVIGKLATKYHSKGK